MKKANLVKRILSIFTVICLSLAMTTGVFAEETPETPVDIDESVGDILCAGTADFVNSVSIPLTMGSGNWSTDFIATVTGNAGARYMVEVITPSGSNYSTYLTCGSGQFTIVKTLTYASSGTYTFRFTRVSGSASTATAVAEICD